MTTTAELISQTRGYLYSGEREQVDKLAADLDNVSTTLTTRYSHLEIKPGSVVSVDFEDMLVWEVSGTTATVERGYNSTRAAHSADAIVYVNPKFSTGRILNAINDELRALSARGLYRVGTADLTFSTTVAGYDLRTVVPDFLGLDEVRYKTTGPAKDWPLIRNYAVVRDMPTTSFNSGSGVILYDGAEPGSALRVRYRRPFFRLSNMTQDVEETTGLHAEAHDILPLGAAIRLAAGRPIKRSFTEHQGDTRRAEEVSTSDALTAPRALMMLHATRISEEVARLAQRYPTRL